MRRVLSGILMVLGIVLACGLVLILVSVVATTDGSADVAREGQVAIRSQTAITSASTVRNGAINATLRSEIDRVLVGGGSDVVEASEELALLLTAYERRIDELLAEVSGEEATAIEVASAAFVADIDRITVALGTPDAPDVTNDALASGGYDALIGSLVDVRDARIADALVGAELAGQAADGVRFIVIFVIPLIAVLIMRSIFRRRRQRETLEAELERQRVVNASKDEFVTNLSHELRTPLTGVYGFALALDEGALEDPDTARELAGLIAADAAELSRMVDDLITAGQLETHSLALTVDEIALDPEIETAIEPFLRTGATIAFTPTELTGVVDRQRFRQIMRNLVSNAVKHGGPNIEIFAEQGGDNVSVFVMDDGDGIDDDRITRLFERYQHEGDEPLLQGSVGLGLAIARQLAVGMGGDLTYTRTSGITYFVVRVPAHRTGRLTERVDQNSLGAASAAQSASQVAKLFAR